MDVPLLPWTPVLGVWRDLVQIPHCLRQIHGAPTLTLSAATTPARASGGLFWFSFHVPSTVAISSRNGRIIRIMRCNVPSDSFDVFQTGFGARPDSNRSDSALTWASSDSGGSGNQVAPQMNGDVIPGRNLIVDAIPVGRDIAIRARRRPARPWPAARRGSPHWPAPDAGRHGGRRATKETGHAPSPGPRRH